MRTESAQPNQVELEAAVYRALVAHLRERTDVQNIDLMNLTSFCQLPGQVVRKDRRERGQEMSSTRHASWSTACPRPWRRLHQTEASAEARARFVDTHGRTCSRWPRRLSRRRNAALIPAPPTPGGNRSMRVVVASLVRRLVGGTAHRCPIPYPVAAVGAPRWNPRACPITPFREIRR